MTLDVGDAVQKIRQQIAAESYLDKATGRGEDALRSVLRFGANRLGSESGGEFDHPTRLLEAEADSFVEEFEIQSHYANDETGFSATLLRHRSTGQQSLSFRSLEFRPQRFGGDRERDAVIGEIADLNIFEKGQLAIFAPFQEPGPILDDLTPAAAFDLALYGFAFAQIDSMDRYYQSLVGDGLITGPVEVTGYSLGSHLATVFTELHPEAVSRAVVFNGPGRGAFQRESATVADMLEFYRVVREDPAFGLAPEVIEDAELMQWSPTEVLLGRARMLDVFAEARQRTEADIAVPSGASGNVYSDARHIWAQFRTSLAFGTTTLEQVRDLALSPVAGDREKGRLPDEVDSKLTVIAGLATERDRDIVALAGVHGSDVHRVFIEDQPNVWGAERGMSDTEPGSLGDTHSIILVYDSLSLTAAFQQIDPFLTRETAEKIYAASSNEIASGGDGSIGIPEGASLEIALDSVRRVLGGDAPLAPTPAGTKGGDFGDLVLREGFHANIATMLDAASSWRQLGIVSLAGVPADALAAGAGEHSARGEQLAYRYALRTLAPLVLLADGDEEALYAPFNLNAELDGLSTQYIEARSAFLTGVLAENENPVAVVPRPWSEPTSAVDLASGRALHPYVDGPFTRLIVFGATHADGLETIHGGPVEDLLFGDGGADRLVGGPGSDYLEGGDGDDHLIGGGSEGDDRRQADLVGGEVPRWSGEDTLVGGRGFDRYWAGAGDTVVDADGTGEIFFGGSWLAGGWRAESDPVDEFVSFDSRFSYALSGTTLTVRDASNPDPAAGLTVLEYEPGRLGIELLTVTAEEAQGLGAPELNGSLGGDEISVDIGGRAYTIRGGIDASDTLGVPVGVIRGLGGADRIDVDGDLPGLVVWGDNAGPHPVEHDDDFIQVDIVGVNAGAPIETAGFGATVLGEGGDDALFGGRRDDLLSGGTGHDVLQGNAGNDTLTGDQGNDWVEGGAGNDMVLGVLGNDRLFGGAGDDWLVGDAGDDRLFGDAGGAAVTLDPAHRFWDGASEEARAVTGVFRVVAEAGDESGDDYLSGEGGDDQLFGGAGTDRLDGGAGDDRLEGEGGDDVLRGGDGADVLWGDKDPGTYDADMARGDDGVRFRQHTDARDVAGDDVLDGGAGNDKLFGGAGSDRYVFGVGHGTDVIDDASGTLDVVEFSGGLTSSDVRVGVVGGQLRITLLADGAPTGDQLVVKNWFAADSVEEFRFADVILSRAQLESTWGLGPEATDAFVDVALGSNEADVFTGTGAAEMVLAAAGDDGVEGGGGDDVLFGGLGDDRLDGGADDDSLHGEEGVDVLLGGLGDDVLDGGADADLLDGGAGEDVLDGGAGDDLFVFAPGWGIDALVDASGVDEVRFGPGIEAANLLVSRSGDALVIADEAGASEIRLLDWFRTGGTRIETVRFDDGSSWDETYLATRGLDIVGSGSADSLRAFDAQDGRLFGRAGDDRLVGGTGDDRLDGGDGNDVLAGGPGDDSLAGGAGGDIYLIGDAAGVDTIVDAGADGRVNVLRLAAGVALGDVDAARVGDDLRLSVASRGAVSVVVGYFADPGAYELQTAGGRRRSVDELLAPPEGDERFLRDARDRFETDLHAALDARVTHGNETGRGIHAPLHAPVDILRSDGSGAVFKVIEVGGEFYYPDMPGTFSGVTWDWHGDGPGPREEHRVDTVTFEGSGVTDVVLGLPSFDLDHRVNPAVARLDTRLSTSGRASGVSLRRYITGFEYAEAGDEGFLDRHGGLDARVPIDMIAWNVHEVVLAGGQDLFAGARSGAAALVDGGAGRDLLIGGDGSELLDGGDGADLIVGGAGDDVLIGGDGADRLGGEGGSDHYYVGFDEDGFDLVVDDGLFANGDLYGRLLESSLYAAMPGAGAFLGGPFIEDGRDAVGPIRAYLREVDDGLQPFILGEAGLSGRDDVLAVDTLHLNVPLDSVVLSWTPVLLDSAEQVSRRSGVLETLAPGAPLGADAVAAALDDGPPLTGVYRDSLTRDAIEIRWGADSSRGVRVATRRQGLDQLGFGIERFVFADTELSLAQLLARMEPAPARALLLSGTDDRDDELHGSDLAEALHGLGGDDRLSAAGGDDQLFGGAGADLLFGGIGADLLDGGDGADTLDGGDGDDILAGGDGSDALGGGAGDDRLLGDAGDDVLDGGEGNDVLLGGPGADTLDGGAGDDIYTLFLGDGHDIVAHGGLVDSPFDIDVVRLGDGSREQEVRLQDLSVTSDGISLTVRYSPDDSFSVTGWFLGPVQQIDRLESYTVGTGDVPTLLFSLTAAELEALVASSNAPPVLVGPPVVPAAVEDTPFDAVLSSVFFDFDPGDGVTLSLTTATGGALPAWLSFDPLTGSLSGTPGNDDVGGVPLRLEAVDGHGASASVVFDVEVAGTNDAPQVGAPLPPRLAQAGEPLSFAVAPGTFIDIDAGDSLTLSATGDGGGPLPSWLHFDAATGTFGGTPDAAAAGVHAIAVTATDPSGETAVTHFDLTVAASNQAPVVDSGATTLRLAAGRAFAVTLPLDRFSDPDGDSPLVFAVAQGDGAPLPVGIVFDPLTGELSGDAPSPEVETLLLSATDAHGATAALVIPVAILDLAAATPGADTVSAGSGDDAIAGGDGDDILAGNHGDDLLFGDAGNDDLSGGFGDDRLEGGDGIDRLRGHQGDDVLLGGAGADDLDGGAGNDVLDGGAGDDRIGDTQGDNRLFGGDGDDFVFAGGGSDWLDGGAGADTLNAGGGNDFIDGGPGDFADYLLGRDGDDELWGRGGNDTLGGGHGDDRLYGGDGADVLIGDLGSDWMHGGDGDDLLQGYDDADYLFGDAGADEIDGGNGDDIADGGIGDDRIYGGYGNDTLLGGEGDDYLHGRHDDDLLDGGVGADELYGHFGDDRVLGGDGNDSVDGGDGNDVVAGGRGDDFVRGGLGDDRYEFAAGDGRDRVMELGGSADQLVFGPGIDAEDLWFSVEPMGLAIDVIGTDDRVRVDFWYHRDSARIESIVDGGGRVLLEADVQRLVDAMSVFAPPTGVGGALTPQMLSELAPVIAASWQSA